jgi:radical SAM superfamily enzyme
MKILYCGVSSKYIQTMPAGWFLADYLASKNINIDEIYHNVNENYDTVLIDIINRNPDKLLLSLYIFNVLFVKKLISDIKVKLPLCTIIVGGPEADEDFDCDYVIMGEGEKALYNLLVNGSDKKLIFEDKIKNLDEIPSPYTKERIINSKNKLIYYESTRGCPFKCTYCMASLSNGVRYFSLDRVKSDLVNLVNWGAKIIKFTDRTFNANIARTNQIFQFILDNFADSSACFHVEVGGDLFTQSTLDILKKMPVGLVQMEAGVQTLNYESLKAIKRVFLKEKFVNNISQILSYKNIHLHLDLIAGLPYDTLETFKQSFDEVYAIRPDMLQLGFLKFLNGTPIKENYNAEFSKIAPYEVITTPTMGIADFAELKDVDWINDKLSNSGKFSYTIDFLLTFNNSPYELFLNISKFFRANNIEKSSYEYKLYETLLLFMADYKYAIDILRFDFLITNNSRKIPKKLQSEHSDNFKEFLKSKTPEVTYIYEEFDYNPINNKIGTVIIKFDYTKYNRVTRKYDISIESED